jgi:subtilisin family serine protease
MAGQRTIKVFADPNEQDALASQHFVVERYDSFVLLAVSSAIAKKLAKSMLVEDITDEYAVRVDGHEILSSEPYVKITRAADKSATIPAPDSKPHHFLVQFIGPVKSDWLAQVKRAGGEIREPMGGFVYTVRAKPAVASKIEALRCVRWVGHFPHANRIAKSAGRKLSGTPVDDRAELPRRKVLADVFNVEFFGPKEAKAAVRVLKQLGLELLSNDSASELLVVRTKGSASQRQKQIRELSAVHGVRRIRERTTRRTCNNVAAGLMGTTTTLHNLGLGLSGEGEIIAVCDTGLDTGDPATIHPDFADRVVAIKSYPLTADLDTYVKNPRADDGPSDLDSGHGSHVAGSVLGNGTVSASLKNGPLIRGLAYRARLVFQAVEQQTQWKSAKDQKENGRYGLWGIPNNLRTLFQFAYSKGARIHSNSWGGGDPGAYDEQCRQLDRFVWDHKDFCVVVAAGNDGTDKDSDGKINPTSITSPATAKNCITVGASENDRREFKAETYGSWWPDDFPVGPFKNDAMANKPTQVAAFSSRGPTSDQRTKPDVVAPGTFILSTRSTQLAPNNFAWAAFPPSKSYFHMGGTSMATPLTAGALALIREYLRTKQKIAHPTSALLKAALIAGAQRLARYAPTGSVCDNHQGFGRVDLDRVLAPTAPSSAKFLDFKPGLTTGAAHSLTIEVQSAAVPLKIVLAYSDFPGPALVNNLNLIATAPNGDKFVGNQREGTSPAIDTKNNVEVIQLASPAVGTWRIQIVGSNVPHGPQDFALVLLGDIQ